jgi:hypothetical protein
MEIRKWQGFSLLLAIVAVVGIAINQNHEPRVWRTDRAPALQPYYVVTQGYVDKKGVWRSADCGEKIEVYHWTVAQP